MRRAMVHCQREGRNVEGIDAHKASFSANTYHRASASMEYLNI